MDNGVEKSPERILIIDDVIENIQLIGTVIRNQGYRISIAQNGKQGLKAAVEDKPDLILLDVVMPEMDGFETCRRLKANPETSKIPVIFLSAHIDTIKKVEGFKIGAVDYIAKPVEVEEVLARIETHLTIKNLRRQLEEANSQLEEKIQQRTIQLTEKNLDLAASEKNYKTLLNRIPVAIYRCTPDTERTLSFMSDFILTISGKPATAFVQNGDYCLESIIHPDDRTMVEDAVLLNISEGESYAIEYRIKHVDGTIHWVFDKGNAYYEKGEVKHLDGLLLDISQRKLIENELRQAQKMELIGTMAGGLAHDFNNVLGGVVGTVSLLKHKLSQKKPLSEEMLEKHFSTMSNCAIRATDMVQKLLSVASRSELKKMSVNLNQSIQNVLKICHTSFDKSIKIVSIDHSKRTIVSGDPTQLEQIFLNLCINASHAMTIMKKPEERQGGVLTVKIESVKTDKFFTELYPKAKRDCFYWNISVSDTGIGIEKDLLRKIFDPFFTTKEEQMGTGLGLSVVQSIVKQHEGFIDVYSKVGTGTVFAVYLPALNSKLDLDAEKEPATLPKGEGLILVVDDESTMRETALNILTECGYDVVTAEDGDVAIELYKKMHQDITLVLLDLAMPKVSGIDVFQDFKKQNPEVKVLLTSGFSNDPRIDRFLKTGGKGFIPKPYTLDSLVKSIQLTISSDD